MENDNHEIYGNPRNTGRRGLQGEAKAKSLLWPHSIGIRGATLLKYKKGLKRPTLAWNEMSFVTSGRLELQIDGWMDGGQITDGWVDRRTDRGHLKYQRSLRLLLFNCFRDG